MVDYVWDQVKGKRGFKTYNYRKLKDKIYEYVSEPPVVSTEELVDWARKCDKKYIDTCI